MGNSKPVTAGTVKMLAGTAYTELLPGSTASVSSTFAARASKFLREFTRVPDEGERDGLITPVSNPNMPWASSEDFIIDDSLVYDNHPRWGDWDIGWMKDNGAVDQGDGLPDSPVRPRRRSPP